MIYPTKKSRFKSFAPTPKIPKSLEDCPGHFKEKWGDDYYEVSDKERSKRHQQTLEEAEKKYNELWRS